MTRKPSCLISCSQASPEGGWAADVGRHGATTPAGKARGRNDMAAGYVECCANGVESARHLCQFDRNCALASSRLAARPLVMMPCLGSTYTVMDQNHRKSSSVCRSS